MQKGGRAEDPAMTFSGILHDVHQEGAVAAVSAHEIEAVKATLDKDVDHSNPEILEGAPTGIQRRRERWAMRTDSVWYDRQCVAARRRFDSCAFCNRFNNDRIYGERQVIPMLLRVT